MPDLRDFHIDEDKVWFTEGFWPEGVPKQIYEIKGIKIEPLFDSFIKQANDNDLWDKDICIFVLGHYFERVTFKTLIDYAKKFGTFLHEIGIQKGDIVAIDLPNSINFVVAYMGIQYIGAVMAGVNPLYQPSELMHELTLTNAKAIVMMDALYISEVGSVLSKTKIRHLITTNFFDFVTAESGNLAKLKGSIPDFQDKIPDSYALYKIYKMKKIIDETEAKEINIEIDPWNDPAVYLMTGGTTGLPKVAMLSHANLISNLYMIKPWTKLKPGMITIGSIPFFHSFGMTCVMNVALTLGMQMLLFPRPPPNEELCDAISRIDAPEGIMYTGVEMLFKRMTDFVKKMGFEEFKEKYDIWKKLTYATQGAGPLRSEIRLQFEEIFCPIRVGYGLTETSPIVSCDPFWGLYKQGKLGLPLPGTDWAIFDPEIFETGPICDGTKKRNKFGKNYTGEICVSGPQVMLGYFGDHNQQEDNVKVWGRKKWLLTGDIGYMDRHGFCKIIDRKKSLIKVSGYSVYPKEVEEVIGGHEMVEVVAVAGLPDNLTGEAVKAWVRLKKGYKPGKNLDAKTLKEFCEKKLTKLKLPKYIEFTKNIPFGLTGKIQRDVLVEKDLIKLKKGKPIKG